MTFITTFIALLIERFFDWSHIRQWRWFGRYQATLSVYLNQRPQWMALAVNILLPVLVVGIIHWAISGLLFGVVRFVFDAFVLVYCLGPTNFWAQFYACIADLHASDSQAAMAKIRDLYGISFADTPQAFHKTFTQSLFVEAFKRIFAVIFWYMCLGVMGALLYRMTALSKSRGNIAVVMAGQLLDLLDWLPVRLYTFIFALGGHFTSVITQWRKKLLDKPQDNMAIVTECGIVALDVMDLEKIPEDGSAEKEALSLLDRVLVMSLVFLALAVLMV